MTVAVEMALQRIVKPSGEGYRQFPYDDATGIRVRAPKGHLTWLYGCNLDTEGTPELGAVIVRMKLEGFHTLLLVHGWYNDANDARKSVFLEIAFNQGLHGLLGYPHMLAAADVSNWSGAALQCTINPDSPPGLIGRYKRLADILLSGVDTDYVP